MTGPRVNVDAEEVARLRASGMGWNRIGKQMGRGADTVRRAVDPGFVPNRRSSKKQQYVAAGKIDHGEGRMSAAAKRDAEQLLAQIPPDTRDFTARLCGDPRPGRSALDQRQA